MRGIRRKLTLRSCNGRLALLALAVVAMLAVAACGGDDDSTTADEATTEEATTEEATTEEASGEPFKAAVMSVGTVDDQSFSQAQYEGGVALGEERDDIEVTIVPNLLAPDDYLEQGAALAREGYGLVLLQHGAMVQAAQDLSEQFPETTFGVIYDPLPEDSDALPSNMLTWDFIAQEGSFLAGALAALATETGTVSWLSGVPFPAITRQPEGYTLGARCVNPDIEVVGAYDGDETFSDARAARGAAEAQIGDGSDVIFTALDGAVNGVYQAAQAADGVRVIAQYFDNSAKAPDVVLASVLYNFQGSTRAMIEMAAAAAQGGATPPLEGERLIYNLENNETGVLAPAPLMAEALTEEDQAQLAEIESKVRSGEIVVPTSNELANPGDADKIDVADIGC